MATATKTYAVDIHTVVKDGNIEQVRKFLEDEEGDVNQRCRLQSVPLHRAAAYQHIDIANMLLDKGAEVDARDPHGQTPLHYACKAGHGNIVELLLGRGAYIECKDKQERTPLFLAAFHGHADLVEALIKRGAKKDQMDTDANDIGEVFAEGVSKEARSKIEALL